MCFIFELENNELYTFEVNNWRLGPQQKHRISANLKMLKRSSAHTLDYLNKYKNGKNIIVPNTTSSRFSAKCSNI